MGVIKDGTISGVLPEPQGFMVHYPAYPSSISRAVDTLGGIQAIQKVKPSQISFYSFISLPIITFTMITISVHFQVRSSKSNKLELRFRPEDPYSHPAFGELRPTNSLLLKISKTKPPPPVHDAEASSSSTNGEQDQEGSLCADIVARFPEAYFFDGLTL